jgi:hypothetical protein
MDNAYHGGHLAGIPNIAELTSFAKFARFPNFSNLANFTDFAKFVGIHPARTHHLRGYIRECCVVIPLLVLRNTVQVLGT